MEEKTKKEYFLTNMQETEQVANQPWRILLVEDDEDDYVLTRAMLSVTRGDMVELFWAQNYNDALEYLSKGNIDVVLVDHYLGARTGLDLVREAISEGMDLPFILLTGDGSYELDMEAAKAGATDYLVKGEVSPPLLERAIRYAIARKRAEQEIYRNAEQIEMQHRLIQQRELERLQIAQDLHDGPLQDLIGMSMILNESLNTPLEEDENSKVVKEKTSEALSLLQSEIRNIRSFCSELRPPALAPYGLEKAIRSHIEGFINKNPDIRVHLHLEPDGQQLAKDTRLALFRIYQELLNNINRHSHASEIWIRLEILENRVRLVVEDNGSGFEVPWNWVEIARQGHLGLVGIRERAEMAGGTAVISSRPGKGTRVEVTTPFKPLATPVSGLGAIAHRPETPIQ